MRNDTHDKKRNIDREVSDKKEKKKRRGDKGRKFVIEKNKKWFLKLTMQQVHTQGRIMHEFRQSHPRIWMVEGKKVKQRKKVPKINK